MSLYIRTVGDLREAIAHYPAYMRVLVVQTSDMGLGEEDSPLEVVETQDIGEYPSLRIGPRKPQIPQYPQYPAHIIEP